MPAEFKTKGKNPPAFDGEAFDRSRAGKLFLLQQSMFFNQSIAECEKIFATTAPSAPAPQR